MIATLLEKLIDRCAQLNTIRAEKRRNLFSDHIAPLMLDFEALHAAHASMYSVTHKRMATSTDPVTTAWSLGADLLEQGRLNNTHRSRILAVLTALTETHVAAPLLRAIMQYLKDTSAAALETTTAPVHIAPPDIYKNDPVCEGLPDRARFCVYMENVGMSISESLARNALAFPDENAESFRMACLHELDELIAAMHASYHLVETEHQKLRKALLR